MYGTKFMAQLLWHAKEYDRLIADGNDRDAERHMIRMDRLWNVIERRYN